MEDTELHETDVASAPPGATLPTWAWLGATVVAVLLWAVMMEAGTVSAALGQSGPLLHELFHDGRHLVGVPCH